MSELVLAAGCPSSPVLPTPPQRLEELEKGSDISQLNTAAAQQDQLELRHYSLAPTLTLVTCVTAKPALRSDVQSKSMDVERPAIHVEAMRGFCLGEDGEHKLMSMLHIH